jgi:peptidoglycan glycosyltransferase
VIGTLSTTLRRLALFVGLLFLALLVNVNVVQVVRAGDLANRPGNTRSLIKEYGKPRGAILVANTPVASSKAGEGRLKYERVYANGPLYASATGFYSLVYGRTGIERAENPVLSGSDPRFAVQNLSDLIAGRTSNGGNVLLTLNPKAQQAAYDGMQGRIGAVVAIQPSTGALLALVQSPSFDPNGLASNDPATEQATWEKLIADAKQPLLNRPLVELSPPGSTFKIVTASAALASGRYTPTTVIDAPASIVLPGTTVSLANENRQPCDGGKVTLARALAVSCNTAMAKVGMDLGAAALQREAELYGFNSSFQVPMTAATSRFPTDLNVPQTAQSAIGQFDVRATALQMAMVAAGVANRGVVMTPYLVQEVRGPDLAILETATATPFNQVLTPELAQQMTDMMVGVVQTGTGTSAQIPGVKVAGKTGTAQTAPGQPDNAWFIAFAPADDPQVAVAVLVQGTTNLGEISGGRLAAPVAKAVIEAVLQG